MALVGVAARHLPASADAGELRKFYSGLHLKDLVLARACANGNDAAWECFVQRFRRQLYAMGRAIAQDEATGRELADSVYAELFGLRQGESGYRVSKLASYTGRGSLEGWLRAVLAREYVERQRKERRLVSFDENIDLPDTFIREDSASAPDPRLERATDIAFVSLTPEERMLLASYYLDGRTLAEIAAVLNVHESTISRRIGKILSSLNKRIVRELRKQRLSAAQIGEAMAGDVRDLALNLRSKL